MVTITKISRIFSIGPISRPIPGHGGKILSVKPSPPAQK